MDSDSFSVSPHAPMQIDIVRYSHFRRRFNSLEFRFLFSRAVPINNGLKAILCKNSGKLSDAVIPGPMLLFHALSQKVSLHVLIMGNLGIL
jgi:hypothetical protein